MASDKLKFILIALRYMIPAGCQRLIQRIKAAQHRWTYQASPSAQNVVVLGGSFAGFQLSRRLIETLPSGYKVTMIEKNSHFNWSWVFPRFSVIPGYERQAFIPYDGIAKAAPKGIFELVRDRATDITAESVRLASGREIEYAYLAIATGSSQPVPAKVPATDAKEACRELQAFQQKVQQATPIAVVGGGAVGIEIASDIKSFFPDKDVTLFHSRDQLLPQFDRRLHDYVMGAFKRLGVHVVLQERPQILSGQKSLRLSSGGVQDFGLIIPCTGQRPTSSSLLSSLSPTSISKSTGHILVHPTLQISSSNTSSPSLFPYPNILSLGDISSTPTPAPKMARAAQSQAEIALQNILAMIRGHRPSAVYTPNMLVEGAIKLTMGRDEYVMYAEDQTVKLLVPGRVGGRGGKKKKVDLLGIGKAWEWMGVEYKEERGGDMVGI